MQLLVSPTDIVEHQGESNLRILSTFIDSLVVPIDVRLGESGIRIIVFIEREGRICLG